MHTYHHRRRHRSNRASAHWALIYLFINAAARQISLATCCKTFNNKFIRRCGGEAEIAAIAINRHPADICRRDFRSGASCSPVFHRRLCCISGSNKLSTRGLSRMKLSSSIHPTAARPTYYAHTQSARPVLCCTRILLSLLLKSAPGNLIMKNPPPWDAYALKFYYLKVLLL